MAHDMMGMDPEGIKGMNRRSTEGRVKRGRSVFCLK